MLTNSTALLTKSLQQFIKNHLSEILRSESLGAYPGDPSSLPKKRRKYLDDESILKSIATKMIRLVEELMNRIVSGEEAGWVPVSEDEVFVRSLVRANIAMLHPSGTKLKLIDFHKEIEGDDEEMEE